MRIIEHSINSSRAEKNALSLFSLGVDWMSLRGMGEGQGDGGVSEMATDLARVNPAISPQFVKF